ncbi:MAG: hypothetical protein KF780_05120 [Sphingomonas sp.]|nr:hypothetical protein [Sphingomonas sp.]
MIRFPASCTLVGALCMSPALAANGPPERESSVVVYGDDPCPAPAADAGEDAEIVVCARRPEEERYRIPAPLRQTAPAEVAWGSRVEALEDASRDGRPDSCSVVGSYGQTGCMQQMIRQWYAERRARRD